MKTSDFDYDLPEEFIAQTPVEPRDSSRLLVMDRQSGRLEHAQFRDIGSFLRPGDLLVLNETRVIPARLFARKVPGGGRVEILLIRRMSANLWEALVGGKGLVAGKRMIVEDGPATEIEAVLDGSRRLVRFETAIDEYMNRAGHVPLPPYIHVPLAQPERYQTVYSRQPGSVAAPTAGLHFTPGLLQSLSAKGIGNTRVTLHVGLDTFAPVTEDDADTHKIHTEYCEVSPEAAQSIQAAHSNGGRVIAVGTTSVRTLESAYRCRKDGQIVGEFEGATDLYILPGYQFGVVGAMITNFHLPKSTLIMLVSAFAGRERVLAAYEAAKQEGYRFYSFGDAMLIV